MFGRADDPKLSNKKSIDELNDPKLHHSLFYRRRRGSLGETAFPERAAARRNGSSTAAAPIEEIMARRADAVAINRIPWVSLNK